ATTRRRSSTATRCATRCSPSTCTARSTGRRRWRTTCGTSSRRGCRSWSVSSRSCTWTARWTRTPSWPRRTGTGSATWAGRGAATVATCPISTSWTGSTPGRSLPGVGACSTALTGSPTPPGRRPSTPGCSTHGGTGNARRSGTALAGTPVAERLRCRRCGAARSHRLHHPAHDPRVLADLPDAAEPVLLEQLDGPAPEEPPVCLAPGGHLGYGLDETAAGACDLVQRALQRGSGHALATVPPVDEDARDPPVRTRRRVLVVLAPVLDVRKLLGAAVLRPSLRGAVRVEDEGGVGAIGTHAFLLEGATVEPPLLALRVETEAPA